MVRIYRCIIAALMVAAIAFGIWYVVYTNSEQRSVKDGTLVYSEENRKEYGMRGVWGDVSDQGIY